MIEPDPRLEEELHAAHRRYPIGDHVTGVITLIPRPGAIGLFVDLGDTPTGFVDALNSAAQRLTLLLAVRKSRSEGPVPRCLARNTTG